MKHVVAIALLLASASPALAQQNVGRYGVTICITGGVADACAPVYALPSGAYTVKYTGSLQPPRNSQTANTDDNSILDCGPNNTANVTITLPTSTSTVFPPGHGVGVKNSSNGGGTGFTCTVTVASSPNTSIYGAGGVVNGNPAVVGGPIAIFPGGEAYFTVDKSNKWLVTGIVPGVWYQTVNGSPAAKIIYSGIAGYPTYDINCMGLVPVNQGDDLRLQFGTATPITFLTSGYNWLRSRFNQGSGTTVVDYPGSGGAGDATAISLTGSVDNGTCASPAAAGCQGAQFWGKIASAPGTGAAYRIAIEGISSYFASSSNSEGQGTFSGALPYSTSNNLLTGLQIYNGASGSNLNSGSCWLRPSL